MPFLLYVRMMAYLTDERRRREKIFQDLQMKAVSAAVEWIRKGGSLPRQIDVSLSIPRKFSNKEVMWFMTAELTRLRRNYSLKIIRFGKSSYIPHPADIQFQDAEEIDQFRIIKIGRGYLIEPAFPRRRPDRNRPLHRLTLPLTGGALAYLTRDTSAGTPL